MAACSDQAANAVALVFLQVLHDVRQATLMILLDNTPNPNHQRKRSSLLGLCGCADIVPVARVNQGVTKASILMVLQPFLLHC